MPKKSPMSEFDKQLCERVFFSMPGLSDSQIGLRVGLKRQSIQGWRSGKSRPTLEQINTISNMTKISWSWFTTGMTTDYYSIAFAYLPIYFDTKVILNISAYELARQTSATLLSTMNSRLFLPALALLLDVSKTDKANKSINSIINNAKSIYEIVQLTDQLKVTNNKGNAENLYSKMKKSYSPLLTERIPEYYSRENNTERTRVIAYTSFKKNRQEYHENSECPTYCHDTTNIIIVGNDLAPVINSNQEITAGPITSIRSFVSARPILAIVKIIKNSSLNNQASIRLCRYMYCTNDKIILTTSHNQVKPYILAHCEVEEILPLKAVLWN